MSSEESRDQLHSEEDDERLAARELLPAYALGVLDDDERLLVETELATSPDLRVELQQHEGVVDELNSSHEPGSPSPELKQRILRSAGSSGAAQPVPIRRNMFPRALVAAAAVLILVMGGAIAVLADQVREREQEISDLQAASSRPSTDFTQPLVWSNISAVHNGTEVSGYFCRTEDGNVGWIIIEGMHTDNDRVLQLWLVDDDRIVSGGMFATDEEGRGFGVVRVSAPVHSFEQIWITAEPPQGSPQPTSDPDLTAPIV